MKRIKKKKAWLGAAIGAIGAIAGAIGNGIKAKKDAEAKQEAYENQQGQIFAQNAQKTANIFSQEAQNQGYVQQMKDRITYFKMGGNFKNRFYKSKNKKKKANLGATTSGTENAAGGIGNAAGGIISGIGSAVGGIGGLVTSLVYQPKDYTLKNVDNITLQTPKIIKNPYNTTEENINQEQQAIQQQNIQMGNQIMQNMHQNQLNNKIYKLGGKRIKQKNLNRFK